MAKIDDENNELRPHQLDESRAVRDESVQNILEVGLNPITGITGIKIIIGKLNNKTTIVFQEKDGTRIAPNFATAISVALASAGAPVKRSPTFPWEFTVKAHSPEEALYKLSAMDKDLLREKAAEQAKTISDKPDITRTGDFEGITPS